MEFIEELDLLIPVSENTWELGGKIPVSAEGVSYMEWNDFHKSWDPPYADLPFTALDPVHMDEKFASCKPFYRYPWYLSFLNLWHGIRCWWSTGQWPVAVLYFPKGYEKDKELYVKIHAELAKDPTQFFRY